MIFFTGTKNCAWEAVLIRRVREMNGLQKHSSEFLYRSVFSVRISFRAECPACEGQKSRLCCPCLHSSSGLGVIQVSSPTQCTVPVTDDPTCRHALHYTQMLIRHVYPVIDSLGLSEIKWSPLNMQQLVRTKMRVVLNTSICLHLKKMLHDIAVSASYSSMTVLSSVSQ